ncbi:MULTISPECIES: DUF736 family protein [unclassified Bradyrhizobium]|uniref:DUF736 domain-containing protein n=1 Tax=unclassified Bradyrhizobium TaxID=2631580 RepID=UPI0020B37FD2|nr:MULTISPECIES: DUF736 family protein [unclassified Bradyrhizobium]MCP3397741.1 DUF736 family protein [Bradyrhizobium sp. CCGB20]MCP3406332.1 DUF736 family protein [Bradyrhizobium sp. CCGB01]
MTAIGFVTRTMDGGFSGELKLLPICAHIDIVPNRDKSGDITPDFRIFAHGVEVGSGRILSGESFGTDYLSLSLAAPGLGGRKLCTNLGRTVGLNGDGGYFLVWNPVD